MTKRNPNILDKIGNLIPGYKGYVIRHNKRDDDKKLRIAIASEIEQAEGEIIRFQKHLIINDQIKKSQEWEIARKALNTFSSKIKFTAYGESSFFSKEQINETELEVIYSMDLELSEMASLIYDILKNQLNETLSPLSIIQQIQELNELLLKRNNYINKF